MFSLEEMFSVNFTKDDIEALREVLAEMKKEVWIYTFVDDDCKFCANTIKLVDILVEASPVKEGRHLLRHKVFYRREDEEVFDKFRVTRVPTVLLLDGYIRYTGMPAGEEVRGLVETIIRLSTNDTGLSETTATKLGELKGNVHIEVIVTPTCPYCPYAALLANMFAFESYRRGSKAVIAETVEAYENPDIADKYGVMSVPVVAVNGVPEFVGLPYEEQLLQKVIEKSEKSWLEIRKKKLMEEMLKELMEKE